MGKNDDMSIVYCVEVTKLEINIAMAMTRENIKCPDDDKMPWITGCTVLPGNQILLCDYFNNKIKLLDTLLKVVETFQVLGPWDVDNLDPNEVIITQPNEKKLQIIQAKPHLKLGKSIPFDIKCWGISTFESEIFISCHRAPGCGEIRVVDKDGDVKRIIGTASITLECPSYIHVNPSSAKLYVSDSKTSSIYCMSRNGELIYRYSSSDLCGVRGIHADENNAVVVCGRDTNNLYMVSPDGKTHKTLLVSNKSIPEPCCVTHWHDSETKLVVGCYENDSLCTLSLR